MDLLGFRQDGEGEEPVVARTGCPVQPILKKQLCAYNWRMAAIVLFHHEFAPEFGDYEAPVRDEIMKYVLALRSMGPEMGRPRADTLSRSEFSKMKELRPTVNKVEWRVAYAFDTEQQGILLAGGSKNGVDEDRFYRGLIDKADRRFKAHEAELAARSKLRQTASAMTPVKGRGKRK
jgi:hypothetical protein